MKPLPFVKVPAVMRSLSTDRVLTMSFMEGVPLGEWLSKPASQSARNRLGARLLELFLFQVYRLRRLHADPHPGNYLIDDRGNIGLVDYGCVKRYTPEFAELTRCYLTREWLKGEAKVRRMQQLVWGKPVDSSKPEERSFLMRTIRFAETLYPDPRSKSSLIDFGDRGILDALAEMLRESVRVKMNNPEFIFHSRAEWGLYNVLHRLNAKVDTGKVSGKLGLLD